MIELSEHEIELTASMLKKKLEEFTQEELLLHLQHCDGWIAGKKSKRNIYGLSEWEAKTLEQIEDHRLKVLDRIPVKRGGWG